MEGSLRILTYIKLRGGNWNTDQIVLIMKNVTSAMTNKNYGIYGVRTQFKQDGNIIKVFLNILRCMFAKGKPQLISD